MDVPPQLGAIPKNSEFSVPTLSSTAADSKMSTPATNGTNGLQNAKDTIYNSEVR